MNMKKHKLNRKQQSGAVLAISLIMLLILTLLGVASMRTTTLEERMAGNAQNLNLAFQAAEAALRDGESYLTAATLPDFDGTTAGLYQPAALGSSMVWKTVNWGSSSAVRTYSGSLSGVASQPKYIIEELSFSAAESGSSLAADTPVTESKYYRVTARGVGTTDDAVVVLESIYKR